MRTFSPKKNKNNNKKLDDNTLTDNLSNNVNMFKDIFSYPTNMDFIVREIYVNGLNKKGAVLFLDVMIDNDRLEKHVISPLIDTDFNDANKTLNDLTDKILRASKVEKRSVFKDAIEDITQGKAVVLVDSYKEVLSIELIGYKHRSVESTQIENVIKGPKEAFTESNQVNRSLIRKYLKNENLVTERIPVGEKNLTDISMLYLKDIADPELVKSVRERIRQIKADGVQNITLLEQHIEERPYSLVPTLLYTERPDRAVAFLNEGHIVLLDQSPACLVLPVTFWSLFHSSEDQYSRWAYANFMRIIRFISFLITLLTPAIYVGMINYHAALIPTDLLLSIAASREVLPFPGIIEVLLMEISFEILREAGVRIPKTIGAAISIVGVLILGEAAVEANIVSPIMVIIISITGLSSFAIPETSTNYMIRLARFVFLASAIFIGFLGIAICLVASVAYLCSIKSFGVSFLSPYAPYYPSSRDMIFRSPIWKQWLRPFNISPQDKVRVGRKGGTTQ
ncbi:MAG: spore germination protein [Bacillota bacterium]